MFHAVRRDIRQEIGDERVTVLEGRELAKHGALFPDDRLHVLGKTISIAIGSLVVERDPKALADVEGAEDEIAHLGRAVNQVVEVGSRKRVRVIGWMKLRRNLPRPTGCWIEPDARRAMFEATRPHQR